jgi:hypothetical protein
MIDRIQQRATIVLFVLVCSAGALFSIAQVRGLGNDLSNVDRYSEANALREVHNFFEQGLTRYDGLGDVQYPGLYPADGFARDPEDAKNYLTPEGVYTHYPPGPEYLLYGAAKLMGLEPVSRLRLLPISIGLAATLFLGFSVRRRFGEGPAWLVMGACAVTPSVTDGFIGLHYQGYAAALVMIEIAICIGKTASLMPFVILGFFQGWLSFDYVFLVTLVPVALEVAMPRIDPGYRPRWRLAVTRAVLAGAGFGAAHGLHFLQVWGYWGSFGQALRDFGGAAAHRSGSGMIGGPIDYLGFALGNLKAYFYGLHPLNMALDLPDPGTPENWSMFRFLGMSLGPWWLLITLGMVVWAELHPKAAGRSTRMDWYVVCLSGMVPSSAWFMVMINHGDRHRHFLYRHLFFTFFVVTLFGAVTICRLWAGTAMSRRLRRDSSVPVASS